MRRRLNEKKEVNQRVWQRTNLNIFCPLAAHCILQIIKFSNHLLPNKYTKTRNFAIENMRKIISFNLSSNNRSPVKDLYQK